MKRLMIPLLLAFCLITAGCGTQAEEITSPDYFSEKTVGVLSGSFAEAYCTQNGLQPELLTSFETAAFYLRSGDLDYLICEKELSALLKKADETITEVSGAALPPVTYCLYFNADNTDLKYVADVVVTEASKDNAFLKLCKGFRSNLGADRNAFETASVFGSEGTVVLGVVNDIDPITYVNNGGKYAGMGVEFAKRIASKKNKTLSIQTFRSSAELQQAVLSGSVDFYFDICSDTAPEGLCASAEVFAFNLRVLTAD